MATALSNLTSELQLETTDTSLIVTSTGESVFIGRAVFTNTSASSVTVEVYRLGSAVTAVTGSGGNWIVSRVLPPGASWICSELTGMSLAPLMRLSAVAAVASVINVNISGTTES